MSSMSATDHLSSRQFSLVTEQHHPTKGKVVKRQRFDTADEAERAGRAIDPLGHSGHVYPNVSDAAWNRMHGAYHQGLYTSGNRYAVIIDHSRRREDD